ncbi:hypothetical protein BN2537_7527 [Streptomyces venezuelae]|nr:hypothetical protein BN2537_7527 [Streptomyces venezuelae]
MLRVGRSYTGPGRRSSEGLRRNGVPAAYNPSTGRTVLLPDDVTERV